MLSYYLLKRELLVSFIDKNFSIRSKRILKKTIISIKNYITINFVECNENESLNYKIE